MSYSGYVQGPAPTHIPGTTSTYSRYVDSAIRVAFSLGWPLTKGLDLLPTNLQLESRWNLEVVWHTTV